MTLTIRIPLPSPMVGGRARKGDSSSEPVMSAIEEFRALVAEAIREPIKNAEIDIEWIAPADYDLPETAERYVRQALEDEGVVASSRALAGRVTEYREPPLPNEDPYAIVTVEEAE